jgi:UPF0755 protein
MRRSVLRFFFIGIGGAILFVLAGFVFLEHATIRTASTASTGSLFSVEEGMGAQAIAHLLREQKLISGELPFLYYLWKTDGFRYLQKGQYALSPSMNIQEIANLMRTGGVQSSTLTITIPEGYRAMDIERRLKESGIELAEGEFLTALKNINAKEAYRVFGFSFLQMVPQDSILEGYLFPDTYHLNVSQAPEEIIGRMLSAFNQKVMPLWNSKAGMPSDPLAAIANIPTPQVGALTLHEIVILASLLEKEVQTPEDMRLAAGVFKKRLEVGMPLQVDATLAYITGKKTGQLSNADKLIDSPYNTYMYKGLPVGPISNPGLNAIQAALDPAENYYWYYLSTPDGTTIFSKTLVEHNQNKARYLSH